MNNSVYFRLSIKPRPLFWERNLRFQNDLHRCRNCKNPNEMDEIKCGKEAREDGNTIKKGAGGK